MSNKWDDTFNRDDSSSDPEQDFESFLRDKVKQCSSDIPASQLQGIPELPTTQDKTTSTSAADAGDASLSDGSVILPETEQPSERPAAPVADEKVTEIELRTHEWAGVKTVTAVEVTKTLQVDEEWIRIRDESYHTCIVDLVTQYGHTVACEKIIQKRHELNRLRFLIPAQQLGLSDALEQILQSVNAEDRIKLLEMDKQHHAKQKARGAPKSTKPKAAKKAAIPVKKTEGIKAVDTLVGLGFDRMYIATNLLERGLMDKVTGTYLAKQFETPKPDSEGPKS